jgi:hypothetical protein
MGVTSHGPIIPRRKFSGGRTLARQRALSALGQEVRHGTQAGSFEGRGNNHEPWLGRPLGRPGVDVRPWRARGWRLGRRRRSGHEHGPGRRRDDAADRRHDGHERRVDGASRPTAGTAQAARPGAPLGAPAVAGAGRAGALAYGSATHVSPAPATPASANAASASQHHHHGFFSGRADGTEALLAIIFANLAILAGITLWRLAVRFVIPRFA